MPRRRLPTSDWRNTGKDPAQGTRIAHPLPCNLLCNHRLHFLLMTFDPLGCAIAASLQHAQD
jgi:hypothetical protein